MYEIQNYNAIQNAGNSWIYQWYFPTYPIIILTNGYQIFDIDSKGNQYFVGYTTSNIYDHLIFSLDQRGRFRWSKTLKDSSDILRRGSACSLFVQNDIVYISGFKRVTPENSIDYDSFLIAFDSDGTLIFNKSETDNPRANALVTYSACYNNGKIIQCGCKWYGASGTVKPLFFIYDLNGKIISSKWTPTGTTATHNYHALSLEPNVLCFMMQPNTVIKYNYSTNTVLWNRTLNNWSYNILGNMQKDFSGNIYVYATTTDASTGNYKFIITKLGINGNLVWSKTYYISDATESRYLRDVKIVNDKLYMVFNSSGISDPIKTVLARADLNGNIEFAYLISSILNIQMKNNSVFGLTYSGQWILNTKLNLDDLEKYSKIKIAGGNMKRLDNSYIKSTNTGITVSNKTDISFVDASYLTSNLLSISDSAHPTINKFRSGIYYK